MFEIIKESKPVIITEVGTGKKRKLLLEEKKQQLKEKKKEETELTNLTKQLTKEIETFSLIKQPLDEDEQYIMDGVKEGIINLTDTVKVINEIHKPLKKESKLPLETEFVEMVPEQLIPSLKFYELISRINTIIDGYEEIREKLSWETTNEIRTEITKIESTLTNMESILETELKNNLIYKI